MSICLIKVLGNFSGIVTSGFTPNTFNAQNGVPGSVQNGIGAGLGLSTLQAIPFFPGFAHVISSDHGTFDVKSPPPGFHLTTGLTFKLQIKVQNLPGGDYVHFTVTGVGNSNIDGPYVASTGMTDLLISAPDYRDYFQVLVDQFLVNINQGVIPPFPASLQVTPFANAGYCDDTECGMSFLGNYDIIANSSSWTIENLSRPSASAGPYIPGDQLKLSSTACAFSTFDQINSIDLNVFTPTSGTPSPPVTKLTFYKSGLGTPTFDDQAPCYIIFTIPLDADIPTGDGSSQLNNTGIVLNSSGTLFSGSVVFKIVTILSRNNSGVYTITTNKRDDTIYVDSTIDASTMDFAIPDPFFKTGFIGG